MASLTPVDIGVMRMPLSPRTTACSIAAIWPASSPSCLPEAMVSSTLFFSASAWAPFCMATKNGLLESLVMSETPIFSSPPGSLEESVSSEPQAEAPSARATIPTDASIRRAEREDET